MPSTRTRRTRMANLTNVKHDIERRPKRAAKRPAPTTEPEPGSTEGLLNEPPVKRKRGRPRKNPLPASASAPPPRTSRPVASFPILSVHDNLVTSRSTTPVHTPSAGIVFSSARSDHYHDLPDQCLGEIINSEGDILQRIPDPIHTLHRYISLSSLSIPSEIQRAFGLEEKDRPTNEDDSRETYKHVARHLSYKLRKLLRYADEECWPSDEYYFGWGPDDVHEETPWTDTSHSGFEGRAFHFYE